MSDTPFSTVIIASNRGPLSFSRDEHGESAASRGTGGLVTALTGALSHGGVWVASAMSEDDRAFAEAHPEGYVETTGEGAQYRVRSLTFSPDEFDGYYNYVSNGILWFLHHYLWDTVRAPVWRADTQQAWERYVAVNAAFAAALAEEAERAEGTPAFLIQDYHLSLVPAFLRDLIPDALISHFSHTPMVGPTYIRILPTQIRRALLRGLLGADVLGFHSQAWAQNFLESARAIPEARVDFGRSRVLMEGREILVKEHPMSIEVAPMRELANAPHVAERRDEIEDMRGDGALIVRVDRMELTKNILRGFLAFEAFLQRYPEWTGKVRFLALLSPSRTELPEYQSYTEDCLAEADRINRELGTSSRTPIEIVYQEDYDGAVAAYTAYDVLMVNPVIDGLNLVSMEGPVVNRRHGVLLLSRNAGSYSRLRKYAIGVNPYDIDEQAEALHRALTMPEEEKTQRARGLSRLVRSNPPSRWISHQLRDLERVGTRRAWFNAGDRR
ncbi:MAG: trehalose-6-phosphate synthase [Actinomycetota bacterium]